jgi:hypothetical protein
MNLQFVGWTASLKEQLEEKESEVKRLQEKLFCKLKGEGIEILDRGKNVSSTCIIFIEILKV